MTGVLAGSWSRGGEEEAALDSTGTVALVALAAVGTVAAASVLATAADLVLPFDVQPGLQPHACVVMKNGSRITAWAVDTWAAGNV